MVALAPGKLQGLSEDHITKYVEELPGVTDICECFQLHAIALASLLYVSTWACGVEIWFRTWHKDGQVRLHGHWFLKRGGSAMRCEDQRALSFMTVLPHMRDSLWGKKRLAARGPVLTIPWPLQMEQFIVVTHSLGSVLFLSTPSGVST